MKITTLEGVNHRTGGCSKTKITTPAGCLRRGAASLWPSARRSSLSGVNYNTGECSKTKITTPEDVNYHTRGCSNMKITAPVGANYGVVKQKLLHLQDGCVEALHLCGQPLARALCAGQRPEVRCGFWVLGRGVYGVWCRVLCLGMMVQGIGMKVLGLGFWGSVLGVWGLAFEV